MTLGKFLKHGSTKTNLLSVKFIYSGSSNHLFQMFGKRGFWSKVQLIERIVRLNAVENLCQSGILGMNQHSLHPLKHSVPQKLTISGVSFASSTEAFTNTPDKKLGDTSLMFEVPIESMEFLSEFLQESLQKVYGKLSDLVLSGSINFLMIFTIGGRRRRIQQVNPYSWKAQLSLVKACKLILPEVVREEQIETRNEKAFYEKPAFSVTNLPYWLLSVFNKKDRVQIKIAFLGDRDTEVMCGKLVSTYQEKLTSETLAEAYQVELLLEAEKVINDMTNNKQTVLLNINSTVNAFIRSHPIFVRMLL